jgi:hypothetical protein
MKVILDIRNPHSQYHKYNGLTFETRDLMRGQVGVLLKDNSFGQTDFSFNEIIIVDFQGEIKSCVKHSFNIKLEKLIIYANLKRIDIANLIEKYESC